MFEISTKKVDFEMENTIIKRNVNLDKNLDCFILVSSSDSKLAENILNNTLEYIIDKISTKNTYKDFSISLENINAYIKTWNVDQEKQDSLDMIIWILNWNNYLFSNIWKSSLYLLNKDSEVLELTDNNESRKDFSYISSWDVINWEILISSTISLLHYLSKSDLIDWLILSEDIEIFNKNIKNILKSEIIDENCLVSSLKFKSTTYTSNNKNLEIVKNLFMKTLDNGISKQIIAYSLIAKDKLKTQSKMIKSILILTWIAIAVVFLYFTLSKFVYLTTQTEQKEEAKNNILVIKDLLRVASENISNVDEFEKNISDAEDLIETVKKEEVYLNDLSKISDTINILKKQFNKIEIFEEDIDTLIYENTNTDIVKIIKNDSKWYILNKKGIICYENCSNSEAKIYTFNSLNEDEYFVDAAFISNDMYILTNQSKIVNFSKNGYFEYVDVTDQDSWEQIKEINTYSSNLYTLTSDTFQINKHASYSDTFRAWTSYLENEDLQSIWKILSVAIDWWFYILKEDLSIVKFFSSPYRLESLVINNLPENYDIETDSIIDLKARSDLNYVYLLLNNKIWVFEPNTTNFKNTQSLTYLWQIEWAEEIKDFYVNYDWEILVLNKNWIYKLNFEVSDKKLIIR